VKHVILGTAGHIDHGKTALIKALTGVDTDRLKEEKARGISIDLGFAELELANGTRVGVVDVPGHERFVKNMLAGAGGIDAVLFVVAADEGVMPQTREHLDIVNLLGVDAGLVALTKRDLVEDEEWLRLVEGEVRVLLSSTRLADAPILPVSSTRGDGLEALRAAIEKMCETLTPRSSDGPARLPIDRVFTVEGFGTVVTGTLWSGSVVVGDRLALLPGPERVARVRNVQVHGKSVERARAGQRTALALHGIDKDVIERGHTLVTPEHFRVTHMVDARLEAVSGLERPLANRQRVRFHLGASEVLGRLVLLEGETMRAGESGLVELRLEEPVVARRGDRFVIRSYSPMTTVAGGTVIDVAERKTRRFRSESLESLRTKESGSGSDLAAEHLRAAGRQGLAPAELEKRASLVGGVGEETLTALEGAGRAVRAEAARWYDRAAVEDLAGRLLAVAGEFQRRNPLRWGIGKEELRSRLPRDAGAGLVGWLLETMREDGKLQLQGDRVRAGNEELVLSEAAGRAAVSLRQTMHDAGNAPPLVSELEKSWRHPDVDLWQLLDLLVDRGELTKVAPDLYYDAGVLEAARRRLVEHLASAPEITVGDVKTILGVSRKFAVPLLEFLDRDGTTRRVGDRRVRGSRPL
jgi:selenocysteine-specific elongation factor